MPGVLVTAGVFGLGYLIALVILRGSGGGRRRVHLLALGLAPGLGLGFLSLALFFLLHFELGGQALWWLLALLLASLAAYRRFGAVREAPATAVELPRSSVRERSLWGVLLLITLYVLSLRAWGDFQRMPIGKHDAVAIWNARALFLYRAETGHQALFRQIRRGGREYPLGLPAAVAAQYVLGGAEDERIPQATSVLPVLGLALLVYLAVGHLGSWRLAPPAVLVVLSVPLLARWAFSQGADLLTAYLALAATFGLSSRLPAAGLEPRFSIPPTLAGFFLGFLAWTKSEGAVLAVVASVLFFAFQARRGLGRSELRSLGQIAAGAAPGFLALVLFKTGWVRTGELGAFLSDVPAKLSEAGRWQAIVHGLFCEWSPLCRGDRWGILWLFLAAGLGLALWHGARTSRHRFLISVFWATLLAYLALFLITPYPVAWHVASALDRLLLQLFPLIVVWVFGTLQVDDDTGRMPPL